jgi:hypothetical protein
VFLEWILASRSLKNMHFFTDFGSDLQKNGAFWRKVCFLKVAITLKYLQFTFVALVEPVGAS